MNKRQKNVFGLLNTGDRIDGADFIVRRNAPELLQKMDSIADEARAFTEKATPSRRWALLRTLLLTAGMMFLMFGIFNANSAGVYSFAGIFQTSPVLMIAAIVSVVLAVVMVIVERVRAKKAVQSEDVVE